MHMQGFCWHRHASGGHHGQYGRAVLSQNGLSAGYMAATRPFRTSTYVGVEPALVRLIGTARLAESRRQRKVWNTERSCTHTTHRSPPTLGGVHRSGAHRSHELFRGRTDGCLSAECWLSTTRARISLVCSAVGGGVRHASLVAGAAQEVDLAYDEREARPASIVRVVASDLRWKRRPRRTLLPHDGPDDNRPSLGEGQDPGRRLAVTASRLWPFPFLPPHDTYRFCTVVSTRGVSRRVSPEISRDVSTQDTEYTTIAHVTTRLIVST
ncbi:hypothetical protein GCM10020219_091110 [Nonomuraea dietziae]